MALFFRIVGIAGLIAIVWFAAVRLTGKDETKKTKDAISELKLEKDAFDFSALPVIEESSPEANGAKKAMISVPAIPKENKPLQIPPVSIPPPAAAVEQKSPDVRESTKSREMPVSSQPPPEQKSMQATPPLPLLDEESILAAVVKIQCPTEDGKGKYIGSGFSIAGDRIVTAAHVVKDSGEKICDVIFPGKNRKPIHYLRGTLEDIDAIKKRHDERGIDIAFLTLSEISAYPEARAIFSSYPVIPYSFCKNPEMLSTTDTKGIQGDVLLHFGYPSNFVDQNYLAEQEGRAVTYADIAGIKDQYSDDFSYQYKTPEFSYTADESKLHPYLVSRVASFYGDSGGLAFNAAKQCVLGPHRGGTVGRGAGENYSIFPLLGWWEENK